MNRTPAVLRPLTLALAILLIPATLRADPVTLVDTGPGPSTLPGFSLSPLQWVAVEFSVTASAVITSVDAWMTVTRGGFLDVVLYGPGSDTPGAELHRATAYLESGGAAWRGLSGLAWTVGSGSYWLGLETPGPTPMSGSLPYPSLRPLSNGAVFDRESDRGYEPANAVASMGLRIMGEEAPAPVPEPASLLLLTTGLAGIAARRVRSRRRGGP